MNGKENKITKRYHNYYNEINKSLTGKICCKECKFTKLKDTAQYKASTNKMSKDDVLYWSIRDNRMNELRQYLNKHRSLDGIWADKHGRRICDAFKRYGEDITKIIEELGFKKEDIKKVSKVEFYSDFAKLEEDIIALIEKLGRFPTCMEIYQELDVSDNVLRQHGGMYEIKRKMNYHDENDLLDDNGWYNKSSYEYIVAQFLIHNTDIQYKREQMPFPKNEKSYRSDFTFYLHSGEPIHVEVWGFFENNNGKFSILYNENKNEKLSLYKKYGIKMISIEPELFQNKYEDILEQLRILFEPYVSNTHCNLNINKIIPPNKLTDLQLFQELEPYMNDNTLPSVQQLKQFGMQRIYAEILKRYGKYHKFADAFNVKVKKANDVAYWTLDKIFSIYLDMINSKGQILSFMESERLGFPNLRNAINKYGGFINVRLKFYEHCLNNNITIPKSELIWLYKLVNRIGVSFKNKNIPLEQQELASILLRKLSA